MPRSIVFNERPSLNLSWRNPAGQVPVQRQAEAAECGLACLAMVASAHGFDTDVAALRKRFAVSARGTNLAHLLRVGEALHLQGRAVRAQLHEMDKLQTPCILHWDLNHFVVLVAVRGAVARIHDPAAGLRRMPLQALSEHFTGVALELTPMASFVPGQDRQPARLSRLLGPVQGWRRSAAQVLLLAAALEFFALLSPLFMQWVVDGVVLSADRDLLATLTLGFALLVLLLVLTGLARSWAVLVLSAQLSHQWVLRSFAHLMRLPLAWFEHRQVADVQSRFGALQHIQRTLTGAFVEALLDGALVLITFAVMCVYSLKLAALSLLAVLLYGGLRWVLFGRLRAASEEALVREARQSGHFLESVRGVLTLKILGAEPERVSQHASLVVGQMNAQLAVRRLELAMASSQRLLFGLERVAVVGLGALMVLEQSFTVGMLFAFFAWKETFSSRVSALVDKGSELRMLRLHAERLADIVLAEPEAALAEGAPGAAFAAAVRVRADEQAHAGPHAWDSGPARAAPAAANDGPRSAPHAPGAPGAPGATDAMGLAGMAGTSGPIGEPTEQRTASAPRLQSPRIELRDVRFRYAPGEPEVLCGIHLVIEPGESVAITGPSGCGKSTLVKLLLGLYQPTGGSILIDGQALADHGLRAWRQQVGAVMQDDVLFGGSVADNLCHFAAQADALQIEHCAKLACVHEDILNLPMGYHTLVGDMGQVGLSGGQRQRLLLARSLYHRPRLLLLDEATSALDVERERQVNQAVRSLALTRVVVAHRPETIAAAGRVVALAGGRVAQDLRAVVAA